MLQKKENPRTAAQSPFLAAMARAALSVVFSQERDEEIAALRARMVEMQRQHENDLLQVRWQERLEHIAGRNLYYEEIEELIMRYCVPLIEQAGWGLAAPVVALWSCRVDRVFSAGRLNFQTRGMVEEHIIMELVRRIGRVDMQPLMTLVEPQVGLPAGSLVRLSESAVRVPQAPWR